MVELSPIASVVTFVVLGAVAIAGLALAIVATVSDKDCNCPTITAGQGAAAPDVVATIGEVTLIGDGSVDEPSLAFASDDRVGLFRDDEGRMSAAYNGEQGISFNESGIVFPAASPPDFRQSGEVVLFCERDNQIQLHGSDGVTRQLTNQDLGLKRAVRVATVSNGALATAFADGQTVDGVVLATGDRILLKNQTATTENGVYVVQASGAPMRAADFNSTAQFATGTAVLATEGATNARVTFFTSVTPSVVDADPWVWTSEAVVPAALSLNDLTDCSVTGTPTNTDLFRLNVAGSNLALGDNDAPLGATYANSIYIGHDAGNAAATNAPNTVAIGQGVLAAQTTGGNAIAIGTRALELSTSGGLSVAIGTLALGTMTTGLNNVAIGERAGDGITTGNGNVMIGVDADVDNGARTNAVVIGNTLQALADGSFNATHRTIAATSVLCEWNTNELIQVSSSRRYKREIRDLEFETKHFMELRPVVYKSKKEHCTDPNDPFELNRDHIGFIAEEAEPIFPDLIAYSKDAEGERQIESFAYPNLTAVLTKMVQKHEREIAELRDLLA